MKISQEYGAPPSNSTFGKKRILNNGKTKFTKEYKSPQQSKFKMASFTELVKNKSKVPKKYKPVKSQTTNKMTATKPKHNYSYLHSSIRKPKLKAVKHHEIDLNKNNGDNALLQQNAIRKAKSTQKERVAQSNKLTHNVPKRQIGMLSSHKQREGFAYKKTSYNIYSKSNGKRQLTSNSKRKSLAYQSKSGTESSKAYLNEDISKLASEGHGAAQSPDIMKRKGNLTHNMSNSRCYNPYQASYTSMDHSSNVNKEMNDELPKSVTPNANNIRSVVTPSRSMQKKCSRVFKLDPEAFIQSNVDENSTLIVNLEDIVKEEDVIFAIQNNVQQ